MGSRSRPSPAAPAKTPTTAASSASPSTRLVETPKICGRTGTQCVLWRPQILEIAGASGAGEAVDHGGEGVELVGGHPEVGDAPALAALLELVADLLDGADEGVRGGGRLVGGEAERRGQLVAHAVAIVGHHRQVDATLQPEVVEAGARPLRKHEGRGGERG